MILGDSLVVMNSLLERERLAGKVQCIYVDPPYGVKFNSNFQPSISKRDVKDSDDASLTREPEQIQAFRDTWELGVHSYLTYLRDRLLMCRSLLADTGSLFLEISEDNLHHARELLDEVFGATNFISIISFAKTSGTTSKFIPTTNDYLVWYGKNATKTKYRQLYLGKVSGGAGATAYTRVRLPNGTSRAMTSDERARPELLPSRSAIYRLDNATSQSTGRSKGEGAACWFPMKLGGKSFTPGDRATWKTNEEGMRRLLAAERLESTGTGLYCVRYMEDFPAYPIANVWADTGVAGFASDKRYVVETSTKVVERCMLMTTDPGDLGLDPTCSSGTTAFVAEQWGRRWITCDTSRVALALARQRLLAARFPYYRLRSTRVKDGFVYKTVPHITLKAIAQNNRLDACRTREEREQAIRQHADQETLYDKPEEDNRLVRVSGPFTVEAIPVASIGESVNDEAPRPAGLTGASPTRSATTSR
jgi:adenine-specific DNA-methyltransferase